MSSHASSARDFLLSVLPSQIVDKLNGDGEKVPRVTLTFAQSLDGKISGSNGKQLILSGPVSMFMTHWMRSMHDAILVGIGTALNDDPQLNVRLIPEEFKPHVRSPRPVILDAHLRLRTDCKLLKNYRDGKGEQPWVFCASAPGSDAERSARKRALEEAGAVIYEIQCVNGFLSIPELLRKLYEQNIRSVMVEGGATVIAVFLHQASQPRCLEVLPLVDTLIITVAPTLVGGDGVGYNVVFPADQPSTNLLHRLPKFTHVCTKLMGKDTVVVGKFV